MARNDIPHYTDEEVESIVRRALIVADDSEVPKHLQPAVFTQAASLLAAKTVQIMQPQPIDLGNLHHSMRRQ